MYLLDTNVISELRPNKKQPASQVIAWAKKQDHRLFYLSAVSILELEIGIQRLERRQPPQGEALRQWLNGLQMQFKSRILAFSKTTVKYCAGLHVPNPMPDYDGLIAATALEHGFTLVTRNIADFQVQGLTLINPWDYQE